ncbi:MAG: AMP-binding protein, partial [Actinomycetota bacterium]|nr:AMP-binding protein [Actinomycetota bacterium]
MSENQAIEEFYTENRTFPPLETFASSALLTDSQIYNEASEDYESFWAKQARELLTWHKDFTNTLEWNLPYAKWFSDGELNISYNCLDRHIENGKGDKVAYHWEGEPGDTKTITYQELLDEVSKFANVLKEFGLKRNDTVAIYMPMVIELPIAMLACARIGVAHSVIFGGFSPDAIIDRCEDAEAKMIITADAGYRRGEPSALKVNVDTALENGAQSVETVVVVNRCNLDVNMNSGRDFWWHDVMKDSISTCHPEPMPAEQLLYLLYTSG